ncbi:MAG: restriction endonuclease [Firmicutes bacterium]|nr:restriction endonuclease [Bacillota bacterium]
MDLGYFDEMRRLRRQLLDQYWPLVEPAITRLLRQQRTPLTQVQIQAVSALISERFHLGKVDGAYLEMLIKRLENRVLGYQSQKTSDAVRYITIADCEGVTAVQFCRIIRQLFSRFGYQGKCEGEHWLELSHPQLAQKLLVYAEVQNRIIHLQDLHVLQSFQKEKNAPRAIFVTVGSFGPEVLESLGKDGVELWDGNQLGALLDRVRLSPRSMLD